MAHVASLQPRSWTDRSGRRALTLALLALGVAAMIGSTRIRGLEATSAATAIGWTGKRTMALGSSFVWGLDPGDQALAGSVTYQCTSAFLLGPLLIVGSLLAAAGRFPLRRVAFATAACVAVAFSINLIRLLMIAWAYQRYGWETGYEWAHVAAGSVVTIFGATGAVAVFVLCVIRGPRAQGA